MANDIDKSRKPATQAAQALGWLDPATNAVAPPVHPSTNYARDENYEKVGGRGYTRDENPTYEQVEALLATLEEGADAMVFGSGMAAATTVMLSLAPGDTDAIANAIKPGKTKLVWVESPCNPTWDVTDIEAAAKIAHDAGALLGVDSTAATPVLSRPLAHGADIVMHSATKYLNGHGDVLAGVLVSAREDAHWERMKYLRFENGGMLGAFEAWLLMRGLRTLYLRVERASASALRIANYFADHPAVVEVMYPGLPGHPGHAVAARQMTGGYGGMMSIRVKGGAEAALMVAKRVQLFARATSLGGVESLIEHRATVEGDDSPFPDDLLRLSIGIEDADDLIADLEQALAARS